MKLSKILDEHGSYGEVREKVEEFIGKISKIEEGSKESGKGATGDDVIGNAKQGEDAVPANKDSINSIINGFKTIVDIVLKNEGNFNATKTGEDKKSVGKLFGSNANDGTEAQAAAASASIGAVSGADILQAIAKSDSVSNDPKVETAKNAADIAAAKKEDHERDYG